MHNLTVLTAKDIVKLVNLRGKEKGIEISNIEINNEISFSGQLFSKIKSKISGSFYIKEFCNNCITLGINSINVEKLMIKGVNSVLLKSLLKISGERHINIKGNDVIVNLDKYEADIEDVYVKDKLLYIIGSDLDMYLNA